MLKLQLAIHEALTAQILWIFVFFPIGTRALAWDDFTNNFATDIAPLITLFGEQVTKQFLSESLSIWDNVIFAMAPLGILTAVVSVIRVCGSASLRAFIGRAQEGPGIAEAELLSCTSETTGEIWNEGGIARVFGTPQIFEFVVKEKRKQLDRHFDEKSVKTFSEACEPQYLKEVPEKTGKSQSSTTSFISRLLRKKRERCNEIHGYKEENYTWRHKSGTPMNSHQYHCPNLSLNIGIKRLHNWFTYGAAALGVVLQSGVLILGGLSTTLYHESFLVEDNPVDTYAFPLTLIGTLMVCFGMFLCAYIIERTTDEVVFEKIENRESSSKLYLIQPGGQKIGDQVFGSFIGVSDSPYYIQSTKSDVLKSGSLWVAVSTTMVGFVVQFVGLRGMHPSIILAQIAATLIMAVVRAMLRTQRMDKGRDVLSAFKQGITHSKLIKIVQGHELDFFSLHVENISCVYFRIADTIDLYNLGDIDNMPRTPTNNVLRIRAYLADATLSPNMSMQSSEVAILARQLQTLIQNTMQKLSKDKIGYQDRFVWKLDAICKSGNLRVNPDNSEPIYMTMWRSSNFIWNVDNKSLEAVLGLWAWAYTSLQAFHNPEGSGGESFRVIEFVTDDTIESAKSFYRSWIQRRGDLEAVDLDTFSRVYSRTGYSRLYFGVTETPIDGTYTKALCVKITGSILKLCAQDIFISFLRQAFHSFANLNENRAWSRADADARNIILLKENVVDEIALDFEANGIGSLEDAYMCIYPNLKRMSKMPNTRPILQYPRVRSLSARDENQDHGLQNLYSFFRNTNVLENQTSSFKHIGDFYIQKIRSSAKIVDEDIEFAIEGVWNMLRESQQDSVLRLIATQYVWIVLELAQIHSFTDFDNYCNQTRSIAGQASWKELGDLISKYFQKQKVSEESAIFDWAKDDQEYAVKFLIAKGCNVDDVDENGRTLLSWAAQKHNYDLARFLLRQSSDITILDNNYRSALSYAAESGCVDLLRDLLEFDSKYIKDSENNCGKSALAYAIENGNESCAKELMVNHNLSHTELLLVPEKQGTLFTEVIRNGWEVVAIQMMNHGVEFSIKCPVTGDPPLHQAVKLGFIELVGHLLDGGYDWTCEDSNGKRAIEYALDDVTKSQILKLLFIKERRWNGARWTTLHLASLREDEDLARKLIDQSDINSIGVDGSTPLILATRTQNESIVKLLLDKRVNLEIGDHKGYNALQTAVEKNNTSIASMILDAGGSVNGNGAMSPLHIVALYGPEHLKMGQLLIKYGAVVDIKNNENEKTPLHTAAHRGCPTIVKFLLDNGADINQRTSRRKKTALHKAVTGGKGDIVKLLLDSGADIEARTHIGQTPLYLASLREKTDIGKILLESGADPNSKSDNGLPALFPAINSKNISLIKLFVEFGADINATSPGRERSGLHTAVLKNQLEIVKYLVDEGANTKQLDKSGKTPYLIAVDGGFDEIAEELRKYE